jgi:uncharacterized protein YbjQ (UPF0145 family)
VIDEVVTFEDLAGYRQRRDLGSVSGTASRPRNLLRSTFRSLGLLVGLLSIESLSEADALRAEAIADLRRRAGEIGANAVIGVQFRVDEEPGGWRVTAVGRALDVERTA